MINRAVFEDVRAGAQGRDGRRPRPAVPGRPHHLQDVRGPRQPLRSPERDPAPDVRPGAGRRARPPAGPGPRRRGRGGRGRADDPRGGGRPVTAFFPLIVSPQTSYR